MRGGLSILIVLIAFRTVGFTAESLPAFDPEPAIAQFGPAAQAVGNSGTAPSCACADGRTFAVGDTILFHDKQDNNRLKTATLTSLTGCTSAEFEFPHYYVTAGGKVKKSQPPRPGKNKREDVLNLLLSMPSFTDDVCKNLLKPEPRRSIKNALAADPSLLNNTGAYEIPEDTKTSGNEESRQRKPPESGNLLEGPKGGGPVELPGGFKAGDYVFVPKDKHIHGHNIPRETIGVVLGSAGKNGDKLRVAFIVHKTGRMVLDFVTGMVIPPLLWTPMNPYQVVMVSIDPEDVWGISVPRMF